MRLLTAGCAGALHHSLLCGTSCNAADVLLPLNPSLALHIIEAAGRSAGRQQTAAFLEWLRSCLQGYHQRMTEACAVQLLYSIGVSLLLGRRGGGLCSKQDAAGAHTHHAVCTGCWQVHVSMTESTTLSVDDIHLGLAQGNGGTSPNGDFCHPSSSLQTPQCKPWMKAWQWVTLVSQGLHGKTRQLLKMRRCL